MYTASSRAMAKKKFFLNRTEDFPGGAVDKNPPANVSDTLLIGGLCRFHTMWSN